MARLRQVERPVEALPGPPAAGEPWRAALGDVVDDDRLAVELFLAARSVTADLPSGPPGVVELVEGRWSPACNPGAAVEELDAWLGELEPGRRRVAWWLVLSARGAFDG